MRNIINTIVLTICAMQPIQALACACCAEPGSRFQHKDKLSDYDYEQTARLRSDGIVEIHTTDCGDDCILGIGKFDDWHQSSFSLGRDGFALVVNGSGHETPDLVFSATAPTHYEWLATDPMPGDRGLQPGGLYSEATIPLKLRGSGPGWTGGPQELPARLILIGQSTACMELGSSTHWMLDAESENISFRLFGRFATAKSD